METLPSGIKKYEANDNATVENFNANADLLDEKLTELDEHVSAAVLDHPDNSVTDAKIGDRTIVDTVAPVGDSGGVASLFGSLANMVKSITGKGSWRTSPATTLEAANTHINATASVHGATSAATADRIAIRDANGRLKVGTPSAADDVARKDTVDNAVTYGVMRNAIINGGFDISQRIGILGSMTLPASGGPGNNYGYALDRWWTQAYTNTTNSASITVSQQAFSTGQTIVPNNPKYYCRIAITSLPALGANSAVIRHIQRIEGVHHFSSKQATLSFWAKASTNRTIAVSAGQDFGAGGSAGITVGGQTMNLSTSWQLFTLTFSFPSISGKTVGEHNHLSIKITPYKQDDLSGEFIPSGQVGSWTTGNIDIAQVVLNEGANALPFHPRSFAEELSLCLRYFQTNLAHKAFGTFYTSDSASLSVAHVVPMRVPPTIYRNAPEIRIDDLGTFELVSVGNNPFNMGSTIYASRFDIGGFSVANTFRFAKLINDSISLDAEL